MAEPPSTADLLAILLAEQGPTAVDLAVKACKPGAVGTSVGSSSDGCVTRPNADKKLAEIGSDAAAALAGARVGYACKHGFKSDQPNQDAWIVVRVADNFSLYGVFDGHGKQGHDVADLIKDILPKVVLMDARFAKCIGKEACSKTTKDVLTEACMTAQALLECATVSGKVDAHMAGCTATLAIHNYLLDRLTVAHLGDSCAVIARAVDGGGSYSAIELTREHKPSEPDEMARVIAAGGTVHANRIYAANEGSKPGLNMSRSLGDIMGHQAGVLSNEPEVREHDLTAQDSVILLCSDGVWTHMKPKVVVDLLYGMPGLEAKEAAQKLARKAWDTWMQEECGSVVDDITVILVYLGSKSVA